nr:hypothetical protein [Tanacetum cinerariifolium]
DRGSADPAGLCGRRQVFRARADGRRSQGVIMATLELRNVNKTYGAGLPDTLKNIELSIKDGEFLILRHESERSRHRHGVSVLRAVPDHERAREHRIRPQDSQDEPVGHRRRSRPRRQAAADRTPAQSQAGSAVRWPAAARCHGSCTGA